MKIFGIGTDIVNIKRIEKSLRVRGLRFKNKIFTIDEIKYCDNKTKPASFYAKRYAAKEAMSKALGTGIRKDISFKNIEVSNNSYGKPLIKLKGATYNYFKKKINNRKYKIHLSLSDDKPWAQATVIITYK